MPAERMRSRTAGYSDSEAEKEQPAQQWHASCDLPALGRAARGRIHGGGSVVDVDGVGLGT